MSIQRYEPAGYVYMDPNSNGFLVYYTDHAAEVERLTARVAELTTVGEALLGSLDSLEVVTRDTEKHAERFRAALAADKETT